MTMPTTKDQSITCLSYLVYFNNLDCFFCKFDYYFIDFDDILSSFSFLASKNYLIDMI